MCKAQSFEFPKTRWLLLLVAFAVLIPGFSSNLFAADVLWRFNPAAGYVDTSPAVGDLDGDGVQDLVLCTTEGRVLALDANGHIKWATDLQQPISNPPTLAGQPLRIYIMTNPGNIFCLDPKNGAKLWTYRMPSSFQWGMAALAAADMTGNGQVELIAADHLGHLVCLKKNGTPLWKTTYRSGFNTAPAVADLNGDDLPEILLGATKQPLVCFSNRGKRLWQIKGTGAVGSSPVVADLNGDGRPEILVGEGDGLSLYNAGGVRQWHFPMKGKVHDAIAVGDVDRDGRPEIVILDLLGKIVCLTPAGKPKWTASVAQRTRRSPAIADIDGDSKPEVVVGNYSDALYVFDGQGNLKQRVPLNGGMNAAPTIVDFHGDGQLSVVCATISDVVALRWMPKRPGALPYVAWAEYRANSARTGALLKVKKRKRTSIASVDYGPLHVGLNHLRVTVANPQKRHLTLRVEIRKNMEAPLTSRFASSDSAFSYQVPYSIAGQNPVAIQFQIELRAGKKLLAQRRRTFYLVPFAKDVADLRQTIATLGETATQLPEGCGIEDQIALLKMKVSELAEASRTAGTMSPLRRAELRTRFQETQVRASRLRALTRAAIQAGSSLAAYAANPWAPFGGMDEIVEGRTQKPDLKIEAFEGEIESAAINLANFSRHAVVVRVEPQNLRSTDSSNVSFRKVFEFHEVLDVPTHSLELAADALPKMNQARTVTIPAQSVRQIWLNVNASKLRPGKWTTRIRFRTLEVEPKETMATLKITVWPIRLSRENPLRLCTWGYVYGSVLKEMPNEALRDKVRHGTNVFVATNRFAPRARFNGQGDLVGKIDFSAHDDYVRRHSPYGMILFFNYEYNLTGPAKPFSPIWAKAYKRWISAWVQHLLKMGLTYNDFAFYPVDEPGLRKGQIDQVIGYAKPIRQVNKKIHIYVDPVVVTSLKDLKRMAPFVDIWCPNRRGYLLHQGAKKLDFLKSTGAAVWTYDCEGDAKQQSPLGYYRAQAWLAWQRGLTGIGFWSYCTSNYDPWYVPRGGQDYLLIYQGDGVVTSKRWEAVRDGTEDYDLLAQLREAAQNPPAGVSPKVVRAAKTFLNAKAQAVAAFCGLEQDGTLPGTKGPSWLRKVADRRWQTIQAVRHQMAELLLKLQGKKTK